MLRFQLIRSLLAITCLVSVTVSMASEPAGSIKATDLRLADIQQTELYDAQETHPPAELDGILAQLMNSSDSVKQEAHQQDHLQTKPAPVNQIRSAAGHQDVQSTKAPAPIKEKTIPDLRDFLPSQLKRATTQTTREPSIPSLSEQSQTVPERAVQPASYLAESIPTEKPIPERMKARGEGYSRSMREPLEDESFLKREFQKAQASQRESFIETESSEEETQASPTMQLVYRISGNLIFVLAIAVAFVFMLKQWQKGKQSAAKSGDLALSSLQVIQVVPLSRGASLHLVQSGQTQFVVAIDAAGIKSVNVLNRSFDQEMAELDLPTDAIVPGVDSRRDAPVERAPARRVERTRVTNKEATSEIDEQLIEMLLRAKQSA